MVLLSKEKEAIKNNYFSLWEIVSLLAKKTDDDFQEVGEFLGHINISAELCIYQRDQFSRLYQLDTEWSNNPVDEIITILNGIFPFDSEEEQKAARSKAWGKSLHLYWLKEDIYNFKPIMDLGIIEKPPTQVITVSPIQETQPNKSKFFLYKQPLFTINECACIASEYDPLEIQRFSVNDVDEIVPDYSMAYNLINSAVEAGILPCFNYKVNAEDLKEYLANQDIEIKGFNEPEYIDYLAQKSLKEQKEFNNRQPPAQTIETEIFSTDNSVLELEKSINKLKVELQAKDAEIEQLKNNIQKESSDAFELLLDKHAASNEINQLKAKIEQLESEQLHSKQKSENLLNLIFDESATERYAPDLVSAIKLWEHIYITSPKDDSHTNKADTWLGKNTGYDTAKKQGSSSKIREITAPFINWSTHRDKAYKK